MWSTTAKVQDVAVSHDFLKIIAVNADKNLKVIDTANKRESFTIPEGDAVTSICGSKLRDEVLVSISSQPPQIRLWSLSEKRVLQRYSGHQQGRFVVRTTFGGGREQFVCSGSEDSQIYIWHRQFGTLLEVLEGHSSTVNLRS